MKNRRKTPRRENSRATVSWPATIVSKHATIEGRVKNLSRGGALLHLKEQLELEESIRIAIEIPEYNDVISTEAEVVRIYPLEAEIDNFSYAVGVRFTDISPQDLRFFTGNLAPEWQKNYREPRHPSRAGNPLLRNLAFGLLGAVAFSSLFLALRANRTIDFDPAQIASLESRLRNIELQLELLPEVTASNRNLIEQLHEMRGEIASLQEEFATVAAVEQLQVLVNAGQRQLQEQVIDNKQQIAQLVPVAVDEPVERAEPDQLVSPAEEKPRQKVSAGPLKIAISELETTDVALEETTPAGPVYHLVKKGETLYRIARKYGIGVDDLRELNNLSANEMISPDQRLLVR